MKVGKNNFVPPPQVESSMVKIEPRSGSDRPAISFEEWDGMLRFCFLRTNRTFRAIWTSTKVRALIEKNWMTWASMHPNEILELDVNFLLNHSPGESNAPNLSIEDDVESCSDDDGGVHGIQEAINTDSGSGLVIGSFCVLRSVVKELILGKIERVLEQVELAECRAVACDENTFLRLLDTFHVEGIHFA